MMRLQEFFLENPRAAIGLSGGVDSTYLLYAGLQYGADIQPYFIKTAFQPAFELEDARRICAELGVELKVIGLDVLAQAQVAANPANRCYYCKRTLFSALRERAAADGYTLLLDGTNASDSADDRPGMKALNELQVRSPLRECGLTKADVRSLSRKAGLFTADKPSYACLATRIRCDEPITEEKLALVEKAENFLFSLGYSDFRVRLRDGAALLQFKAEQIERARTEEEKIFAALKPMFKSVSIDPNVR